jgi:GNAT superfamily N-acetyltransferase
MGGTTHTAAADLFTITLHDPKRDTDDEIAERVEFANEVQEEMTPGETPTPVEHAIAAIRSSPERIRRWSFRARDASGRLAGMAGTTVDPDHDDNPDVLGVNIVLRADYRRKGLGSLLLAKVVDVAEQEGRSRLLAGTSERIAAGAAFAEATGAACKSRSHVNRLLTADVDRSLLEQWQAEGPERASGYELIGWDGPVPEEHMDKWLDLVLVMNTAPRDDLEVNDFTLTAAEVREQEKVFAAVGGETWVLVARHVESGEWAGFHDVGWVPADPKIVWVDSTGVRPEHRGHALGKWLKAAMQLRITDERPDVAEVRTGNADSNDAMLGINKLMGYKPFTGNSTWELTVADARVYLAARGL